MKLLAVRSLNVNDPLPLLGRKVETKPIPEPIVEAKPTGTPGVFERPDGKFETRIRSYDTKQAEHAANYGFERRSPFSSLELCLTEESLDEIGRQMVKAHSVIASAGFCLEGTNTGRVSSAHPQTFFEVYKGTRKSKGFARTPFPQSDPVVDDGLNYFRKISFSKT